jgi:hypothetical protein
MTSRDQLTGRLLEEIERQEGLTQRQLSSELHIALGLTNLLVKRVIGKGWVKVVNVKRNRLSYLITPAGIAEKTRITRDYFHNTIRLYTETRERVRGRLEELSATWPAAAGSAEPKRVVFYGAGEVAEIAFICLQGMDLHLVGVVDDRPKKPQFLGMPIHPASALKGGQLAGLPFDRLAVMSFRRANQIRSRIEALDLPMEQVFWL